MLEDALIVAILLYIALLLHSLTNLVDRIDDKIPSE